MQDVPIHAARQGKLFAVESGDSSYVFGIDDRDLLRHAYWGPRIERVDDFVIPPLWDLSTNDPVVDIAAEEYPLHGGLRSKPTCVAALFADGSREIRATPAGHRSEGEDLVITLLDADHGLAIDLYYRSLDAQGLIRRWTVFRNESDSPITLTRALSAQLHIPFGDLRFRNTHGQWGAEFQGFTQQVSYGRIVVENRKGISSHNHNASFILDRRADETTGDVWFGALETGGNFLGEVEQRTYGGTALQYGINDYGFAPVLQPGDSLTTPALVFGRTAAGLADMTVRMQAYGRSLMSEEPRLVLYNSWEATGFDVHCDRQLDLADLAGRIGAEMFVLDDGWFGRRNGTTDGLGDWWVNPDKFPDDLHPLIERVKSLGMEFGIWMEPEMVNPTSDLYRDHPDWVYREPGREPDQLRDQYVLDVGLPEVQDFIYEAVAGLLADHDVSYIKWDANRPLAQVGARDAAGWRHTQGLYSVVDRIKQRYPDVLIEACASGGGRVDLGALQHFDDFWTSDNTDALDRLEIQRTYSLLYPMKAMRAWVTDTPNFLTQRSAPLQFRFHSAMMGSLGIGANLTEFSDAELEQSAGFIEQYKRLRPVIQEGEFHRLADDSGNGADIFEYRTDERVAVFVFLVAARMGRRPVSFRLRGLDPAGVYRFQADWQTQEKSGAYLMGHGVQTWLLGDYASAVLTFERVG